MLFTWWIKSPLYPLKLPIFKKNYRKAQLPKSKLNTTPIPPEENYDLMKLFTESDNREIKLPDDMLPDRSQNEVRNHIEFTKPLQLTEKIKRGQDKDHHEKLLGSLGETTSKGIESTGHAVKVSTTGIDNMFHGLLGGVGGRMQWFLIFAIILV